MNSRFYLFAFLFFSTPSFSQDSDEHSPLTKVEGFGKILESPALSLKPFQTYNISENESILEEETLEYLVPALDPDEGMHQSEYVPSESEISRELNPVDIVAYPVWICRRNCGCSGCSFGITEQRIIAADSINESLLPEPILNDPYKFEPIVFPNPANDYAKLAFEVEKEQIFSIYLFNSSGQLVETVHSGILNKGRHLFELDLTEYQSGTSIVQVIGEEQKETLKLIKVN
ncbi:MAG: T9SS type A sorting domain-containing protein [Crocinitomicaceae bacterium]|nr:T9SS type A sorting domain-containing protein [Crocinitomicaceae bacterium]